MGVYALFAVAVTLWGIPGHATLIDNGGGLIYDTDLNITWYDYTYAPQNQGNGGDGATWDQAMSWATGLNAGGVVGWRLPHVLPVNGSGYNYNWSAHGSTDVGYNISAPGSVYPGSTSSEMAYLYYVELGNKGEYDINGNFPQPGWGLVNMGPFYNLRPFHYWSGTECSLYAYNAWHFGFGNGAQIINYELNTNFALAVHSGDVLGNGVVLPNGPTVPIPGAVLLLVPGLASIAVLRRKFKK